MANYKKVEELKDFWLKKVKVIENNGKIWEGVFDGFTRACDNEPELDSIDIKLSDRVDYEIFLKDIKSIEEI